MASFFYLSLPELSEIFYVIYMWIIILVLICNNFQWYHISLENSFKIDLIKKQLINNKIQKLIRVDVQANQDGTVIVSVESANLLVDKTCYTEYRNNHKK